MLCQSFPTAAVLPLSLNVLENQIHDVTHMQTSRQEEAGWQLAERLLQPISVSHRPAKLSGGTFTNTEFSSFQKLCPVRWPTCCLIVVLSPSKQTYSNLLFISLSKKWFKPQFRCLSGNMIWCSAKSHDFDTQFETEGWHVMCTAGKTTFPKPSEWNFVRSLE